MAAKIVSFNSPAREPPVTRTLIAILLLLLAAGRAPAQKLSGAGSTFSYPIYSRWFSEYSAAHAGVRISYQPIGSGNGIRQVSAGLVDFGATDGPMTDYQIAAARVKVLHIPVALGAVVPIFNLPGVSTLRFDGDLLADIYFGKVQHWDDPRIVADNPGVSLPSTKITVVHRSDGSGTSFIFTDYLTKVCKDWASGPGASILPVWPVGEGGKGNAGVAELVSRLPGSLGYVELTYALDKHLGVGEMKNAAGNWVKPSIEGVTEAAASTADLPADYRVSITNPPGANAYPIASFTWLLVPLRPSSAAKGRVLKDLLTWILTKGQSEASALAYAPLPSQVADKVLVTVSKLP